jgi:hypothetical protein
VISTGAAKPTFRELAMITASNAAARKVGRRGNIVLLL